MTKNRAGKPPSQRQLRVGEQVRQAISDMLRRGDIYDPELNSVSVTITEVSISPDLKNAVAYAVPLGNDDGENIIKALNRNSSQFKHYIAKNIDLRAHPRISFKLDTAFDYAEEITHLLNKAKQDGQE
ncbi:MAG: 30S ribosome-binding factor RbfA [Alphaproteobacteria bacterium]